MPRTKKCANCGNPYERLPEHPPFRNWCDSECAIEIARTRQDRERKRAIAKAAAKKKESERRNRAALVELNRSDVKWQKKTTQPVFNRMRVLEELVWFADRGVEPYCISCRKTHMDWCCGHYKSVGANSKLRYDPINSYLQCNRNCNMGLSANIHGYKEGLIYRFGEEEAAKIEEYCSTNNGVKRWGWEELEAMRLGFYERIRKLELYLSNF